MTTALEMLGREALLLGFLGALGAAPASFLPAWVPGPARVALAPAFGLAILSGGTITAAQFMPMSVAAPALFGPLAVASLLLAWHRRLRASGTPGPRPLVAPLLALVVVTLVPAISLGLPLADAGSPGPQAYRVDDAVTYAQLGGIFQEHAWTDRSLGPSWDQPAQGFRALLDSDLFQTTGSTPALAAGASLFGWDAIDTQSAFMIALVLTGALAILAVVLALGGSLAAALAAGLLYGGPLTYQLTIDGSQAALQSLALIPGIGLCGVVMLRGRLATGAALMALLVAGVIPTYPLLLPLLGASIALAAVIAAVVSWRAGELNRGRALRGAGALVAIAVLGAALTPVATERAARYLHSVGTGLLDQPITVAFGQSDDGPSTEEILPRYDLPAQVLPGWILQTRDFYGLGTLRSSAVSFLRGALAPLALLLVVALGLLWLRDGWVFLCALPVAAALALYSSAGQDCSYCVQRNLLTLGPCAAILFGLGLAAMARRGGAWRKAAIAGGAVALALAGLGSARTAKRALDEGTVLSADSRSIAADAAGGTGTLELEGLALAPAANTEAPGVYALLRQGSDRRLGTLPSPDQLAGGSSTRTYPYDPRYSEILTRLAGISTPRQTIARVGQYALQRRAGPFDAIIASGVLPGATARHPGGVARVTGPIGVVVSAPAGRDAVLRLVLKEKGSPQGRGAPGSPRSVARLCFPVPGVGPIRLATVPIARAALSDGSLLASLAVSPGSCRRQS